MRLWLPFITARRQRKANAALCALADHDWGHREFDQLFPGRFPVVTYHLCSRCGHVEVVVDDGVVFDRYPADPKTARRIRRGARRLGEDQVVAVLIGASIAAAIGALIDFIHRMLQ